MRFAVVGKEPSHSLSRKHLFPSPLGYPFFARLLAAILEVLLGDFLYPAEELVVIIMGVLFPYLGFFLARSSVKAALAGACATTCLE